MITNNQTKINQLLNLIPNNAVLLSAWLQKQGYSLELQKHYRNSQWLQAIGNGAMVRYGVEATYEGAVYALQTQKRMSVHLAANTALALLGKLQYIPMQESIIYLFGDEEEKLPTWFKNYDWQKTIQYVPTNFLPCGLGLEYFAMPNFSIKISSAPRAIMEAIYLAKNNAAFVECYELIENLHNTSPALIQKLLLQCNSIKVKRYFLFCATTINHAWLKKIKLDDIDLGTGKRMLVANGVWIKEFNITVPKEIVR